MECFQKQISYLSLKVSGCFGYVTFTYVYICYGYVCFGMSFTRLLNIEHGKPLLSLMSAFMPGAIQVHLLHLSASNSCQRELFQSQSITINNGKNYSQGELPKYSQSATLSFTLSTILHISRNFIILYFLMISDPSEISIRKVLENCSPLLHTITPLFSLSMTNISSNY